MTRTVDWTHEDQTWKVELGFDVVRGRVECVSLKIEAEDPAQPAAAIGRELVRAIPVGRLISGLRDNPMPELKRLVRQPGKRGMTIRQMRDAGLGPFREQPRRGRPPLTNTDLQETAEVYLNANPRTRIQAVADHFTLTRAGASKRIALARSAGFLDPTTPGRASRANDAEDLQ